MLKVEYLPISAIRAYGGNAKEHPDSQIDQIAESIERFGFNDPISIDEDGIVVEGHGRLLAARQLGLDTVPVIRLEGLTEAQRRAYTLVHNQLTMNSGFDIDKLQLELVSLKDFDLESFGFDLELLTEAKDAEINGRSFDPQLIDDEPEDDEDEQFSMDSLNVVQGFETGSKPYFESAFTFPSEHKDAIVRYLRREKQRITQEIIAAATGGA